LSKAGQVHTFQRPHPAHMRVLREQVAQHGRTAIERRLELSSGALKNALDGKGVYPSTIAKIASLSTAPDAETVTTPPPSRDLSKVAGALKELGAATALVLEVLSGVEPANRTRVLDMARAALG
jgi:hypothetical protein